MNNPRGRFPAARGTHSTPRIIAACLAMLCFAAAVREARGRPSVLGTAFTYQGSLKQSGVGVTGTADLQFTLWDALSAGTQVAGPVASNNVAIAGGTFTTEIDFGALALNGDARWLEIAVRSPAGGGAFTTLSPRQPLSAVPYALQTRGIVVDNAGRVGVGTSAPGAPLHIASDLDCVLMLQDTGPASTQSGFVTYRNDAGTETAWVGYGTPGSPDFSIVNARSNGDIILLPFNGYVGIGTTDPGARLDVVANGGWAVHGHNNNSPSYDFFADGMGIHYGTPSSVRWKHNVENIDDPLERVERMRGVFFDWDAKHGGRHDVGMIAEEVGKVLPEVVGYEPNGIDASGMDYSKLTPLLVEAVKALRTEEGQQLEERDAQIASLQRDNQQLQDRLAILESIVARLSDQKENH